MTKGLDIKKFLIVYVSEPLQPYKANILFNRRLTNAIKELK